MTTEARKPAPSGSRAGGVVIYEFKCANCGKLTARTIASPGGCPKYCLACADLVRAGKAKARLKQWRESAHTTDGD